MTSQPQTSEGWKYLIILVVPILLLSISCMIGDLFMMQYNKDRTATSFARDTAWIATYTEYARVYNGLTGTAERATDDANRATQQVEWLTFDAQMKGLSQTAEAPKVPVITGINFPKEIPGNKSTMIGLLYFTDPDGDLKYITYDVVSATKFSSGIDNNPKLDSGDWTNGAIKIYVWCEGQQGVTLRATLYDWEGNRSNSMNFSFACK